MPFVKDENGDDIVDENENKIEYTVKYFDDSDFYTRNKEKMLVNSGDKRWNKRQPCSVKGSTRSSYRRP